MQIKANTPEAYIAQIPEDRIPYFEKLRATILNHIPEGFEEQMRLIELHKHLKDIEREITKQIGTVIIK